MKIRIQILLWVLITFFFACSKDKVEINVPQTAFEAPVVTGYEIRDFNGNSMGTYGNPNIKLSQYLGKELSNPGYYSFLTAPNPCTQCAIFINAPKPETLKKLWIVSAEFQKSIPMQNTLGMASLKNDAEVLLMYEFTSNFTTINLSNFPVGYYRVYLQMGEVLLYDNLLIN